jgi:uncharacterized membrane protein
VGLRQAPHRFEFPIGTINSNNFTYLVKTSKMNLEKPHITKEPSMTKTMSFAVVHFTVAFSVAFAMTGSVLVGGAIALVEPAINTLAYHIHELAWNRTKTGRIPPTRPA